MIGRAFRAGSSLRAGRASVRPLSAGAGCGRAAEGIPAMDIVISAQDLRKHFASKAAVDRISFELARGRAYGLIGPNGAGKTTTLQMLLGLFPPTSGTASVLGFNPAHEADSLEIRKRVGYVPERHHIYQKMTCAQVLTFTSRVYPAWDADECARVVKLLDVPLPDKVGALSRGQLAKLALTIALSPKPEILILDEPTSGLDPIIRREFLDAIIGLIQQENRTVLFSTHIMSDVERVADTVMLMNEGRLLEIVDLDVLRQRFSRVSLLFDQPPATDMVIPDARTVTGGAREVTAVFEGKTHDEIAEIAKTVGARDSAEVDLTLEEIFVEMLGPGTAGAEADSE